MNKKSECETAIWHLCGEWARIRGIPKRPDFQPSFDDFNSWLSQNGYSHYLNFRSLAGPNFDAEMWFDQEFGQTWRD